MKDRCKQAASGMWYARATWTDPLTGERRFKHVTERTQAKCGAALVQVIADGRAGRIDRADTMTVAALLDTWLSAKRGRVRPSSYTYYESCVRTRIIPRLGKVRLHKLTPAVIQRVYREMDEDGMSASAITSTHRVLHNALAFAERQGYVARNPVSLAEPPQYRAPEAAVWTAEHAAAFLSWCDREPMYGPLMALALYTGLRQGELLAIRWSDVDLAAAVLRVRASSYRGTVGEPKTQSSRRSVVLSPACVEMLRRHHAEREAVGRARPADLAFSRPDGRLLSFSILGNNLAQGDQISRARALQESMVRRIVQELAPAPAPRTADAREASRR